MKINNRELATLVAALGVYTSAMEANGKQHPEDASIVFERAGGKAMSYEEVFKLRAEMTVRLADRIAGKVAA